LFLEPFDDHIAHRIGARTYMRLTASVMIAFTASSSRVASLELKLLKLAIAEAIAHDPLCKALSDDFVPLDFLP
jgi:hypothetical protein